MNITNFETSDIRVTVNNELKGVRVGIKSAKQFVIYDKQISFIYKEDNEIKYLHFDRTKWNVENFVKITKGIAIYIEEINNGSNS